MALLPLRDVRLSAREIAELEPAVRVALRSSGAATVEVDDLTQETLTRLLEVRGRLERATASAYAITTARNLARSAARGRLVADRNRHRLLDPTQPDDPVAAVLAREERDAMARALAALPADSRADLLAAPTETGRAVAGARRARLARARAQLRVEYVLALRRIDLPSGRCRSILLAISARDRRRQAELRAGAHLLRCPACASLAEPLLHRRRGLAVLVPVPVLLALRHPWARHVVRTTATVGIAAGSAAALAAGHYPGSAPPPAPRAVATVVARPAAPAPGQPPSLVGGAGTPVRLATGPEAAPGALATVLFATGSAAIDASGQAVVRAAADRVRVEGLPAMTVTGFADAYGSGAMNDTLSQRRAAAVAGLLRSILGPGMSIRVVGASERAPVASNADPDGRAQNRRAVIAAG